MELDRESLANAQIDVMTAALLLRAQHRDRSNKQHNAVFGRVAESLRVYGGIPRGQLTVEAASLQGKMFSFQSGTPSEHPTGFDMAVAVLEKAARGEELDGLEVANVSDFLESYKALLKELLKAI